MGIIHERFLNLITFRKEKMREKTKAIVSVFAIESIISKRKYKERGRSSLD